MYGITLVTNKESVQIILDSLKHLQKSDDLTIFSYVILENHLHLVAQSDDIRKSIQKFKAYTAYEFLKLLQRQNAKTLHWRYSSARDYMGIEGLLEIERLW